jgi:hypothetical protein
MRLTRVSGSRRRVIHGAEVVSRQHLAFLHRRLVEGVHADEGGGDDGLQHEVHHQPAQGRLVRPLDAHDAHRPAAAHEGLGGGPLLGLQQVAHGPPGEVGERRVARQFRRDGVAGPGRPAHHQGEHLVARAGEVELQLAVLVDRAERANRRRALSVLAQALGPELAVPQAEPGQPVDVRHQHRGGDPAMARQAHGERGADGGGAVRGPGRGQGRLEHRPRAVAQRRRVEPGDHRRQQPDHRQGREPPADPRIVVEQREPPALGEAAQRVVARLGDRDHLTADGGVADGAAQGREADRELRQGLGRAARLGDHQEAGAGQVDGAEQRRERGRIDVVHEVQPRSPRRRPEALVGERVERRPAQARAAGAEHDHVAERLGEPRRDRAQPVHVVAPRRQAQQRQALVAVPAAQGVERARGGGQHGVELGVAEPAVADARGKAAVDLLVIGQGHQPVARGRIGSLAEPPPAGQGDAVSCSGRLRPVGRPR